MLEHVDVGDLEGGYALVDPLAGRFGIAGATPFSAEFGQAPLAPEEEAVENSLCRARRFDVLIGYTAEETCFFLPVLRQMGVPIDLPVIGSLLARIVIRVTTERVYGRANRRYARRLARCGARVTRYVLQASRGRGPIGAGHTVDIGLLFPLPDASEQERRDGAVLRAAWTEFARTGHVALDAPERRHLLRAKVLGA